MANGNFGGGTGTAIDPLLVEDILDLNAIRNGMSKYYRMVNDIDLSLESLEAVGLGDSGKGWLPLGSNGVTSANQFSGELNFNYFKIKNIYINRPDCDLVGLFSVCRTPQIRVRMEGGKIIGKDYVGSLSGQASTNGATINYRNISVKLEYIKGTNTVGGVFGYVSNTTTIVDAKIEIGEVSGVNYVGGLAGYIEVRSLFASRCVICIDKISAVNYMGGIIGTADVFSACNPAQDCYVKIPSYNRISGTGIYIGEFSGNINSNGFLRCYSLDTADFFSVY